MYVLSTETITLVRDNLGVEPQLIIRDYLYNIHHASLTTDTCYWKCWLYDTKVCTAKCATKKDSLVMAGNHTHLPDPTLANKLTVIWRKRVKKLEKSSIQDQNLINTLWNRHDVN